MSHVMSPLDELRHSASHILATAVLRLFPDAKLDIGPPTETGFYYDFDLDHKFTADDLIGLHSAMDRYERSNATDAATHAEVFRVVPTSALHVGLARRR